MIHIQPPFRCSNAGIRLFLAGSIEMGQADKWQNEVVNLLSDVDNLIIANPRRDDFDANPEQSQTNGALNEQVTWELDHIDSADIVLMYLQPNTISPISLLELGLIAGEGRRRRKFFMCCPDGFHRKGNVDITCSRYNIKVYDDLYECVHIMKNFILSKI